MMKRLPGKLLLDCMKDNDPVDRHKIISAVLDQLCALEGNGLYHNDLRTWNVLIGPAGVARLIDFGSVTDQPEDCAWPDNIYFSFLAFVHEVLTGQTEEPVPLRAVAFSPFRLPPPYRAWASHFWQQPLAAWSFAAMKSSFPGAATNSNSDDACLITPMDEWMRAVENAIWIQIKYARHTRKYAEALAEKSAGRIKKR